MARTPKKNVAMATQTAVTAVRAQMISGLEAESRMGVPEGVITFIAPTLDRNAQLLQHAIHDVNQPVPLSLRGIGDAAAADPVAGAHQKFHGQPGFLQFDRRDVRLAFPVLALSRREDVLLQRYPV